MHEFRSTLDQAKSWLGNSGFHTFGDPFVGAIRTTDRATESARERKSFQQVRRAETQYARQLRQVARQVGHIVEGLTPKDGVPNTEQVNRALRAYAELLRPWAKSVGARMLADVSRRDWAVWKSMAADMSAAMREEIARAPTGEALRQLLEEQVTLITSMPLKAARRCQNLALEAMTEGRRYETIVDEIRRTGKVTQSRAELIARTEVARAASGLVQARSTYVGSEGYIWRTAQDSAVRHSHKKMSGKFVRWDRPPVTDGMHGHAGQLPNCRCYPEPVLPELIQ